MTYRSSWIEVLDEGQSEPEHPTYATKARTLLELDNFANGFSIRTLCDWASSQGATLRYVDNCWVRVEVSAGELLHFLTNVLQVSETTIEKLRMPKSESSRYIIVSEEF